MSPASTSTTAYGEPEYWDKRYASESGPFDWYQKYSALAPLLRLYIPTRSRVLVVGCGNSAFSEGMVKDGYEEVVNVDVSSVVIEAMQRKYIDLPQLKYMQMDVRDMSAFQSGSFDAVCDKGTLDSILCGTDSRENAAKMLHEVERVLKDNGVYLLITYGSPAYRLRLLKDLCAWTIKLHVIEKTLTEDSPKSLSWELTKPVPLDEGGSLEATTGIKNPDVHYIYVCTKQKTVTAQV
uniref:Methyltransferase type 11 domain-containing protein n=1 Tax=Kalanchoe fedtschenkoi TaxID=63787 RepID=A0A7N1A5G4_KALFE